MITVEIILEQFLVKSLGNLLEEDISKGILGSSSGVISELVSKMRLRSKILISQMRLMGSNGQKCFWVKKVDKLTKHVQIGP